MCAFNKVLTWRPDCFSCQAGRTRLARREALNAPLGGGSPRTISSLSLDSHCRINPFCQGWLWKGFLLGVSYHRIKIGSWGQERCSEGVSWSISGGRKFGWKSGVRHSWCWGQVEGEFPSSLHSQLQTASPGVWRHSLSPVLQSPECTEFRFSSFIAGFLNPGTVDIWG